jgi:hypothetical protein
LQNLLPINLLELPETNMVTELLDDDIEIRDLIEKIEDRANPRGLKKIKFIGFLMSLPISGAM